MKVYPKVLIIPIYIAWFVGLFFFIRWVGNMERDYQNDLAKGVVCFIMFTAWIPTFIGMWLHEKLFPKFYK